MRILTVILILKILFVSQQALAEEQITILAAGDIEWSRVVKEPEYYHGKKDRFLKRVWKAIVKNFSSSETEDWDVPYLATTETKKYIEKQYDRKLDLPYEHHIKALKYDLEFKTEEDRDRYPFQKIAPLIRQADIAFANLETPLADNSRYSGDFRTPTSFAQALKWAGIDVVSTANNHALDAEGTGLIETKKALSFNGIGSVGTGRNLMEARQPFIVEKKGIKIAFFGYTQAVKAPKFSGFALADRSGAMPLDPFLIKEDIQNVRSQVDFIVLSFHWGMASENKQYISTGMRQFAHEIIDAGADIILGHHPHVPRGVELYKDKVIVYSLGNFIFGHNHDYWMDNFLARITLTKKNIGEVQLLPISGRGKDLAQPYVLKGEAAIRLLNDVKKRSEEIATRIDIEEGIGIVSKEINTN